MKTLITLLIASFFLTGCMTKQQVTLEQKMNLCQEYGMVYQILVIDEQEDVICHDESTNQFVYFELIPEKDVRRTGY